ncbi:MAG: HdeA/HdeB family chaperone [Pseudomonadota bacterium]
MFNTLTSCIAALVFAHAVSAALVTEGQASESVDMRDFSCNQYLSAHPETQQNILFWVDGYLSHASSNLVVLFDGLDDYHRVIVETCQDDPRQPLSDLFVAPEKT